MKKDKYSLYILECSDGTLYTGIAKDLEKRLNEHNSSKLGAKYTRGRRPVRLVYSEEYPSKSKALKAEIAKKKLSREAKLKIIKFL